MVRISELSFRTASVRLPVFLPDATRAVLKSLDATDLVASVCSHDA